jgi:hypothetical protein
MKSFGEQVDESLTRILDGFKDTIAGTAVELFGEVVGRTPIKSGHTISHWKAHVGSSVVPTQEYMYSTYVPSRQTALGIAETFKSSITNAAHNAELFTNYSLVNNADDNTDDRPKLSVLENGGYDAVPVHESDPDPPYYPEDVYRPPFTLLTSGAISKKAPQGMVKVSLLDSSRIVSEQFQKWGAGK